MLTHIPNTIHDITTGTDKLASVLFLNLLWNFDSFLADIPEIIPNTAKIIPKYCDGILISLNKLLLKGVRALSMPEKIAPKRIKFFNLEDLNIFLKLLFSSLYSLNICTFFLSFSSSTSINLKDKYIENILVAKQHIIGKYPLIENRKPDTTEDMASR